MVRFAFTLLLTLAWPLAAPADPREIGYDPVDCAAEATEHTNLKELNWLGRLAQQFVNLPNRLKPKEKVFYSNNIHAALVVRNSTCRAWALANSVCAFDHEKASVAEKKMINEEGDALRHFFLSAFLACARGREFAEQALVAHEKGGPADWLAAEKMDIYNNYVAFDWAAAPNRCRAAMTDEYMARAGLRLLKEGKFQTLKKGRTRCADPAIHEMDIRKLTERTNEFAGELATFSPEICGSGKKPAAPPAR